jgi:tRNA pseudouridine55 synthase
MKRERTVFRPLDGILLLDKPPGMSSNQALQRVRHLFRAGKAGHTGSLDPLATGLLPVCFGEATKVAGYLLGNRKAYETTAVLGLTTDSDDADGAPLRERPVPSLSAADLEALLPRFIGRILQLPPIISALKQGGEPLYAKARRGETIEVPEREVEVDAIELLGFEGDRFRLRITCGSGTYIRSIVRDLGELLGCGAHVAELRRLWVDPFRGAQMHALAELQARREAEGEAAIESLLLPVEAGLADWPRLQLDAAQAAALCRGQEVRLGPPFGATGEVLAVDSADRALGLVTVGDDGSVRVKRLFRWAAVS